MGECFHLQVLWGFLASNLSRESTATLAHSLPMTIRKKAVMIIITEFEILFVTTNQNLRPQENYANHSDYPEVTVYSGRDVRIPELTLQGLILHHCPNTAPV